MQRNKLGVGILAVIAVFCVILALSPSHNPKQAEAVSNMETTCGQFATMANEARVEIKKSGYLSSEARDKATALFAEFTPFQRQTILSDTFKYLFELDFHDTVAKVLKAPSFPSIFTRANPDLTGKGFVEDSENVWKLLDAFIAGTYNDPQLLGEEAVESLESAYKQGFWSGMEAFSEEETHYFSKKAWLGVREVFLARFFKAFIDTMKGKVAVKNRGGTFEWPEEPEKEKTWAEEDGAEDVSHLDDNSFETAIAAKKHSVVMFYAPWCGHCKSFKPHFQKAATLLKDKGSDVTLAGVDCTDNGKKTCKKFGVSGYPTVKYFANGASPVDYDAGRTTFGLLDFLNKEDKLHGELDALVEEFRPVPEKQWSDEPEAKDIAFLTDANFDSSVASKGHAFVMFYAPWCGHCKAFKPEFAASATALKGKDIVVGAVDATVHTGAAKKLGVEGYPTIWYFQKGKKVVKYEGARTAAGVATWLADAARMGAAIKSEL